MQVLMFVLGILGVLLLWPIFVLIVIPTAWMGCGFTFSKRCAFIVLSLVALALEVTMIWLLGIEHLWFKTAAWILDPALAIVLALFYAIVTFVTLGYLFFSLMEEDDIEDELVRV
jgi:hypothetical protein